jgi:hypothetical protein
MCKYFANSDQILDQLEKMDALNNRLEGAK